MGLAESTVTVKGQTAVRADFRVLVDASPGTHLLWLAVPHGTTFVRANLKSILGKRPANPS
jgi:hypothetical protein